MNINQFLEQLPCFWQGVLASITAAIILAIFTYVWKVLPKPTRGGAIRRKAELKRLEEKLRSGQAYERTEAIAVYTFNTLKFLFLGNLFWVLPEAIEPYIYIRTNENILFVIIGLYSIKFISLALFFWGLVWISRFTSVVAAGTAPIIDRKSDNSASSKSWWQIWKSSK
jgi:hypothetical protein